MIGTGAVPEPTLGSIPETGDSTEIVSEGCVESTGAGSTLVEMSEDTALNTTVTQVRSLFDGILIDVSDGSNGTSPPREGG